MQNIATAVRVISPSTLAATSSTSGYQARARLLYRLVDQLREAHFRPAAAGALECFAMLGSPGALGATSGAPRRPLPRRRSKLNGELVVMPPRGNLHQAWRRSSKRDSLMLALWPEAGTHRLPRWTWDIKLADGTDSGTAAIPP